jgi:hypothetical protein
VGACLGIMVHDHSCWPMYHTAANNNMTPSRHTLLTARHHACQPL